jgi:hypothetical protein
VFGPKVREAIQRVVLYASSRSSRFNSAPRFPRAAAGDVVENRARTSFLDAHDKLELLQSVRSTSPSWKASMGSRSSGSMM